MVYDICKEIAFRMSTQSTLLDRPRSDDENQQSKVMNVVG